MDKRKKFELNHKFSVLGKFSRHKFCLFGQNFCNVNEAIKEFDMNKKTFMFEMVFDELMKDEIFRNKLKKTGNAVLIDPDDPHTNIYGQALMKYRDTL